MAVPNSITMFNRKVSKFLLLLHTVLYENAFGLALGSGLGLGRGLRLGLGTCIVKHGN